MRDIRVAAAQFEHRNNDKAYNLSRISVLPSGPSNRGRKSSVSTNVQSAATHSCNTSIVPGSRQWPSRFPAGPLPVRCTRSRKNLEP